MSAKKSVALKSLKAGLHASTSSGIQTQSVTKTAGTPAAPAGSTCGCANGGTCVGCDGRCKCKTLLGCHFLGTLKQKRVAAGALAAFAVFAGSHVALYTSMPAGAPVNLPLLIGTDAILALAFTILFHLAQKFGSVWEGLRLGALLMLPMAAASFLAWANHPAIPQAVVTGLAAVALAQGALAGGLLSVLGRCGNLKGKWFGGCDKNRMAANGDHAHKSGGGCC